MSKTRQARHRGLSLRLMRAAGRPSCLLRLTSYRFCAFELAIASCTPLVPFVAKIPSHLLPLWAAGKTRQARHRGLALRLMRAGEVTDH